MMQIFLLLDQDIRPLKVWRLRGKGSGVLELVNAGGYVLPKELEQAFYGAALATLNLLTKRDGPISNPVLAYELELSVTKRIHGESGALAFAIASMYELLGRECSEVIAATGVVDKENGTVGWVAAVDEKFSLVTKHLPKLTKVFYPLDNGSDIHPAIKKEIKKESIELRPVQTLREVYRTLFGQDLSQENVWNLLKKFALPFALLASCIIYGIFSNQLAIYLLEKEHYSPAWLHLHLANWIAFYNGDVGKTLKAYETPIETVPIITIRFSNGKEESYLIDRVPPEFRLSGQDCFAFRIVPYEPLYVYILQSEDSGSLRRLYPDRDHAGAIQITTSIPGNGIFFRLQGKAGNRDIYMVLSRWHCRSLEETTSIHGKHLQPSVMNKYDLEEQSVQLKRIPMSFIK